MKRYLKYLINPLIIILIAFTGSIININIHHYVITINETVDKFTNNSDKNLNLLNDSIKHYVSQYDENNIAILYYEINTQKTVAINENVVYKAGSTYKIGLNLIYCEYLRNNKVNFEDTVIYNEDEDYETGAGILIENPNNIGSVPIKNLMVYSIENSDNIASQMLLRNIGEWEIVNKELSNLFPNYSSSTGFRLTANDLKIMLQYIDSNKDDEYYSFLLNLLKSTKFENDRMGKYIPDEIEVAHKIGDIEDYTHDAGIIYTENPYILIIMTKNINKPKEVIAQISKLFYEYNSN